MEMRRAKLGKTMLFSPLNEELNAREQNSSYK